MLDGAIPRSREEQGNRRNRRVYGNATGMQCGYIRVLACPWNLLEFSLRMHNKPKKWLRKASLPAAFWGLFTRFFSMRDFPSSQREMEKQINGSGRHYFFPVPDPPCCVGLVLSYSTFWSVRMAPRDYDRAFLFDVLSGSGWVWDMLFQIINWKDLRSRERLKFAHYIPITPPVE